MIVSASYRTDIPAFHGAWFAERLAAGFVAVPNPYSGKPYRVSLDPGDLDGFVFWTRNARPFLPVLEEVAAMGVPFVQYTVLGYPQAIDRGCPPAEHGIETVRELTRRFGRAAVVWRYDPVLLTDITDAAWHRDRFTRTLAGLAGTVDEVVLSCARIYRKTERNLTRAGKAHGFSWTDPDDGTKAALLAELGTMAKAYNVTPTVCAQADLVTGPLRPAACIDPRRLSAVAGREIAAPARPHRKCGCAEARDIGAYDTCPMGCAYCYAVRDPDKVEPLRR